MIQTMSSSPNDHWLQFYHQNFPNQTLSTSSDYTSIYVNTTTANALPALDTINMNPTSPTTGTHMSPEGRVSKPTRRRSRASRRTPTTLLNTDTSNFRAMVQQFTGGPVAPFASPPAVLSSSTLAGLGLGPRASSPHHHHLNQTMQVSSSPPNFYHHQLQQQLYQPHNQNYNIYNTQAGSGGDDAFFHRLMSNPQRPPNSNNAVLPPDNIHDGVLMEHHGGDGSFFPNTTSSSP